MRSFKRVFNKIKNKNPDWSNYICFAETIRRRKFSKQTIVRYFNRLVDTDDYQNKDKKSLLQQLLKLSQEEKKQLEDNQF
jgi:predicted RNA-binding protein YlxR (DUF448 family)